MKKYLLFLLFSFVLVLGACGGGDEENNANDQNNADDTEQTEQTDENGTEDTDENNGDVEEESPATDEGEQEEATEEPVEPEETENEVAQLGDTLSVEGVNITVTDVNRFEGRINQFEPLQEDHAIAIDVEVENTNQDSYFIDAMEFTLYDPEGFELGQALPGDEDSLSADLPGGKKAKGQIFFDIPATEGTYELHYESIASWDGSQAVWEIPYK